jgi:aspartyl-tRNA(Asn)/glutamyl-tRNA(Gln) amidotransferase subunit B
MFCSCSGDHFAKEPNTQTCPVCLGLPGAMPVPNKQAILDTIFLGLSLGSTINLHSKFDRKHYFYPDLPKGYQISQYDEPLCTGGFLDTSFGRIELTRAHLEEDTGKLIHRDLHGEQVTLIDFNRSGVPLVEIVTEPQIHSSAQAKEYTKKLAAIIRYLGISDADMEKGSMRLEANISWGLDLGYKVEVKNINSFRYLEKAIDFELDRQKQLLEQGITPDQETRGFNETKGVTFPQRSKEEAMDYRYFPEPDIPAIQLTDEKIAAIKASLPKLPQDYQVQWEKEYQLKPQYYDVLLDTPMMAKYTDEALKQALAAKIDPNTMAGYIVNKKVDINQVTPDQIINELKTASDKISDPGIIQKYIDQAIESNPKAVEDFINGKQSAIQFFLGHVMRLSQGKVDAKAVMPLLQQTLLSKKA